MNIAALEDDLTEATFIHQVATNAGHACTLFHTGQSLLDALAYQTFDMLLLDWNLPDMTGKDVIEWVRSRLGEHIVVMFLTNRLLESNIVEGLMAGADDYMTKPIRQAELTARLHALSKRVRQPTASSDAEKGMDKPAILRAGPYEFDLKLGTVTLHGNKVDVKPKEFQIAAVLFQHAGQLITKERVMTEVWGRELVMTSRTLDTHMSQVRIKLQLNLDNMVKLTTVYTIGYRLDVVT